LALIKRQALDTYINKRANVKGAEGVNILVIWRLLTVGGVNAGWRNRALYFKKHGITTDFLYTKDLGGMHMMEDVANVYVAKKKLDPFVKWFPVVPHLIRKCCKQLWPELA
jgi:hypothetical protein